MNANTASLLLSCQTTSFDEIHNKDMYDIFEASINDFLDSINVIQTSPEDRDYFHFQKVKSNLINSPKKNYIRLMPSYTSSINTFKQESEANSLNNNFFGSPDTIDILQQAKSQEDKQIADDLEIQVDCYQKNTSSFEMFEIQLSPLNKLLSKRKDKILQKKQNNF